MMWALYNLVWYGKLLKNTEAFVESVGRTMKKKIVERKEVGFKSIVNYSIKVIPTRDISN